MANDSQLLDHHLGDHLSGYVDGELTQQERQRVVLHCEQCDECRQNLEELQAMRQRVGRARLSAIGEDQWRETMKDSTVQTSRKIGWILLIAGLLTAGGVALFGFVTAAPGMPWWTKFMVLTIYGGLAVLLYSALRQRLIERKTDKYKDVEI